MLEFGQRRDEQNDKEDDKKDKNGQVDNSNKNGELNGKRAPPGSPLSMLCDDATTNEEEEDSFEIHVGRALDTLRSDYPKMLTEQPGKFVVTILYDVSP